MERSGQRLMLKNHDIGKDGDANHYWQKRDLVSFWIIGSRIHSTEGQGIPRKCQGGQRSRADNLKMTATCRKAFDKLIHDMKVNTGIDFFWLDGTVGSCTLADGAGIGNNTMTDAGPKHEICFSARHAKEALEAIQDEGAIEIVQVCDEQLVVIAKPNRHGTVKLSNQFGSVKELEEGLRGTNFGDNVQAKLNGLSEKTREIEISQLPKPDV